MAIVNSELLKMARSAFEKEAVVPSDAAVAAAPVPRGNQQLGVVTPEQAAQGAAPQGDPAAAGAMPPAPAPTDPTQDPTGAASAAAPPATMAPPPAPMATAPGTQPATQDKKLKPEQMMQMLDYRLYNLQQQITTLMQALNIQMDPSVLVLPPGTEGAPPAESALPGGTMAPPPPAAGPAGGAPPGPQDPGAPMPPGGPMDPSQAAVDPTAGKQAWWLQAQKEVYATQNPNEPTIAQIKAAAVAELYRRMNSAT